MPYTCTWSHSSTAITMVNQPVLNQEWDFSLEAERSHNEGACTQDGERATPRRLPALTTVCPGPASISDTCVPPTVGALVPTKGRGTMETGHELKRLINQEGRE